MEALTDRQREVLDWVQEFLESNGFPPTRSEIAAAFGWTGTNGATDHLLALQRKGYLEVLPNTARGIRVVRG